MRSVENIIEDLISKFDFDKVEQIMRITGHKWSLPDNFRYPTVDEMKKVVHTLTKKLLEDFPKDSDIESGGFRIYRDGAGVITLEYIAYTSMCNTDEDGR